MAIDLFIHPGEYEFADENFCIRTTLGSCVSIVLWHRERRLGGMCHYMLPRRERRVGQALNGKYANEALELMLREARILGTRTEQYEVKLFGGGDMFPNYKKGGRTVAGRNIEAVRGLIAAHGLRITSESLGGVGYRNVIFEIASGNVWVRHVNVVR
ncbi:MULTISPECIES: chemotaxis protein CheD [unclassified Pseudomonas]|uniref:chemotaxis protein CheD n=1 Tax=unclassified Pseudomonas TaxID=196821 RepID=UPI00103A9C6C|nr:chemotaxis protein CheD [Pseudomonas sp. IC_126]TCD22493.1 chemotaxis protein CheD [Pseudomonas sp. IC_126]